MAEQQPKRVFDFYPLEDRVLLSGTGADGMEGLEAGADVDVELADALLAQLAEAEGMATDPQASPDQQNDAASNDESSADAAAEESAEHDAQDAVNSPLAFDAARPLEVIFVDAGVEDADQLLDGLRSDRDRQTQWLVIEIAADEDGVERISSTLDQLSGVDAVHLLSHGDGQGIQLGNSRLDVASAAGYAGQIAGWQAALDSDADLLIYGCDLAGTEQGRELIDSLASLTEMDVAASDDATGHADLGGDWDLEYSVGSVETELAFTYDALDAWEHTLEATADATSTGTSSGGDLTISHTTTGTDRLMLVGISLNHANATDEVTSVTYNGDALSLVGVVKNGDARVEIWSLVAPDLGTRDVVIDINGTSDGVTAGVMTFTDVDQANPLGSFTSAQGSGGSASATVASANGDLVFSAIAVDDAADYDLIAGGGQTEHWDLLGGPNINGGGSTKAGAPTVDMSWTWSGSDAWAIGGVSINSAPAPGFVTTTFQDGADGYSGTVDTFINSSNHGTSYGTASTLEVDSTGDGTPTHQTLIRFDDLFGSNAGQVPQNVYITSASLSVDVTNASSADANISMHAMLNSWSESTTWDSASGGVSTDGSEAASVADASVADPTAVGWVSIDGLEDRVQSWQDQASSNFGWVIESDHSNGWDFRSSDASNAPLLSVTYISPGSQASSVHTLVVDTANDVLDGDATSIDALLANKGADGKISLREAIWAANNTTNLDASTPDQIQFAIGSGAQTIMVDAGGLPTLTDAVVIDATTQPGYAGTPLITLDGTNASNATGGITLRTNDSTVSGFIVQNFVDEGLEIDGSTGFGDNNIIRNNVIVASGSHGLTISNNSDGNWVYGNTIGLAADGTTVRANSGHGIAIIDAGANNLIGSDADGNDDTLERNIISGNAGSGIFLSGASTTQTTIAGNYIGLDASGTSAAGNGSHGILVYSSDNTIGGTSAAARNVISGNLGDGIRIDSVASGNTVLGNFIGTNAAGDAAIGNGDDGISVMSTAADNIIGGATAGAGNLISGNASTALYLEGADTIVQGNYLGTDVSGTLDLGNTKVNTGEGSIRILNATGATIGGTGAGEGNIIAFGGGDGVLLQGTSTGITILGNSIHSHAGLAIDLGDDGVTLNDGEFDDTPDQDGGANSLQNFPVLYAALAGPTPTVSGTLNSTPSRTFRIELFANAAADASGYGEGQRYLGSVNVTTNAMGDASFDATLDSAVVTGEIISATATDLTTNETSEFSQNVTATNSAPVLTPYAPSYNTSEDAAAFATSVEVFLGSSVSDGDAGAVEGVAVTNITGNGAFLQYSLDGGTTWLQFDSVSESNALLLRSSDLVRLTPATDNGGTLTLQYRAWDQTSGTAGDTADTTSNGGSTAFSTASESITVNTASVNDAPIAVDDHHGLSFDGVDDYVNMGSDASLEFTDTMTMELWARPTAYPASSAVLLNKEGEYEIGISDTGSLMWAFANTDPAWNWHDTGHVLQLDEWAHISVTYENGTVNTYVNGHRVETYNGSGTIGDAHESLDDLLIGGRQNNPTGKYFTGEIDEVRLWSTARTQSEILNHLDANLPSDEPGLVGYWKFDEGSGTTAYNLIDDANHGTLTDAAGTGAPQWTGYSTDQDTPLTITAASGTLGNDVDVDGDTLSISHVQGSAAYVGSPVLTDSGALVTVNADGSFDYDPHGAFDGLAAGETGVDSFTYTVSDGNGGSDTATVSITITGTDDAPTIVADSDLDDATNEVIDFQGGDDSILLSGLPIHTADGTDVTVEFWMNWDGTDNMMPFGFDNYDLWLNDGYFGFNTGGGDLYGISSAGLENGWHHVTAVFRNGSVVDSRLIIDGVEQTLTQHLNSPNNGNATATSNAHISGWGANSSYKFEGQIDQLRIWNGARTESQVRADMFTELSGPQTGLVASYSFTGTTSGAGGVTDDSGNGHHGTLSGMTEANVIASSGFDALGDQTVYENALVTLQVSAFDPENAALTYTWTQTSGPAVTLSDANAEKPTFTAPNQAADYQLVFTVDASDGTHTTTETVTINVQSINDAPSGADHTVSTAEDTDLVFAAADFGFSDGADNHNFNAVRITTQTDAGSLYLDADSDGILDAGETVVAGTYVDIADINAGRLKFKPVADANGSAYTQFTFQVQDDGGTAGGGQDTDQSANTMVIDVSAVNDAPEFSGLDATPTYIEGDSPVVLDADASVFDEELSGANNFHGSRIYLLREGGLSADDSWGFNDGSGISLSGNTLLKNGQVIASFDTSSTPGMLLLEFTSANGETPTQADVNSVVRQLTYANTSDTPPASINARWYFLDMNVGEQGTGGSLNATTLMTINITATNDDPTNAGSLPSDITVTEDLLSNVDLSAIDLSDVDHGGSDLTITLSTSTGGNLTATSGGGVTVGGSGTGTVTLTGTQDELNTFLNTASNVQYLHSTANLNGNDVDTIRVQVTDNGNTGSGGGGQIDFGTVNVDISAVNDAPVNTVPGTQTVAEETTTAISGISIGDVDASSGNLTTRLQVSNGVLNVSLSGSATISAGTNGTGDITIKGSVADINATLASLTYTGDTDVVGTAADTLTVTTNDGGNTGSGGLLQDVDTVQIDITTINDAPVASSIESAAIDYTENDGAVAITSTITFSDVDDTHIESATIEISGNYTAGEDFLNFVDQNGITGSWNNGTLTLSGSATLAEYETAIRSITYQNTSDDPSAATRTISFTVNDGDADSNTLTRNIDFTATNDDPTNAGSLPSDITVTEDLLSNVDLSAIDLSDVDHGGSDLTITLSTSTGGNLTATSGGGVTVGGSGTGTVTLTGTQDELNTFLNTASNVQYLHSTANLNGNDADTIRVQVTDNGNTGSGGGGQIDLGTVNVDISAVNDAPVNTVPGTQTVAEETTTAISGISIGDVDASSGNVTTRLQVSNGVINVSLSGSATISSGTNGTGDLTIQGSVADINATLASLTYTGDADVVGTAADTLTVTTNDGGNTGSGGVLQDVDTVQIDITAINDAPVASSIESAAIDYTENDGAVTITSTITFSDVDDTHIESAVVEISGNYAAGEDFLNFVDQNGITGSWNNGTLTLSGTATLAEYETAIRSITYQNTSDDPSAATRTISFTVNDGDVDSNTLTRNIDFTATNDDPTNAGSLPSDITVTEDLLSNVDLSTIDLSDVDHGGSDLTITLSTSTGGNLTASSGGGVTVGGSGTGNVTLTGTQDELNTFLNTASNVQYLHSTANLNGNDADTIRVQVTDNGNTGSGGGGQIDLGTVNVDISAVNDAPVNTVPGTQTVAEETTTAIGGISIADVDASSGNLTTRLQVNNGALNVSLSGSATISAGTNGTGDLTIQGSVADINATLASLTYTGDTDVVGTAADTLTVTTNDGGNTGSGGVLQDVDTVQIDITTINDAPVASSIESAAIDYTENDGAVAITSTIAFSDVDDTHIESATIEISGNYSAGEDFLNFVDQNGITGSWNNGTLTLSGSATLAEYETAIRSITYQNTSDDPSAATRTISFTVNDGGADSNTLTRNIDFTATNDDPTNAGSLPSDLTVTEDLLSNVDLSAIDLSDVDHGGSDLTITLSTSTGGNLTATSGGGVTVGGSGTGTVTLTGTQDELNTFLNTASNVQYLHSTANLNGNDADTIRVQVTDNGNTGSGGGGQIDFGTVNVDINAVNDAPINTVPGTQTVAEETTTAIGGISIGDVDASSGNVTTRLQVSNGALNVSLSGSATISAGTNGTGDITIQGSVSDINATLASLTYTGDTDVVGTAADTLTVTTNDGGNTGSGGVLQDVDTVQIDITAVNDAPVASSIEPAAIDYTENDGAVAITSAIAFSDVDDTHIESATIEISGNYASGEDFLNFVDQNGITGSWNNGTLTLSGTATLAEYETAIRSITYQNTSDDPSAATRTISFTVNDGDADSNTLTRNIDFTATNDDPTNAGSLPSDITVTEDLLSNVDLSAIDLSDVDHGGSDLTITLSTSTGGNLTATSGGGVTVGGSGTGTVTLTGTQDELNTFLNTASNVRYLHATANLNGNDADTIRVQVTDNGNTGSGGGGQIDFGTVNVDISAVNDAPVNTVPGTQTVAEETTTAIGGISIGDVDASSGNLTTRLQVSNGVLNVSLSGSATISSGTNGTGDITIQGSVTDINATLASLTYTGDTDVVGTAADTLTVTTNDGGNTGSGGALQDVDTVQIDITAINDAPVASSIEPAAIDYTENDGAVTITSTITFSDVDDTHIESATIEISGNYASGEDILNFVDQNGITGTWNNGTLTLTGSATLAEYEAAIRSITYQNTSDDPSAATRTISFTVNDGDADSNTLTRNIDFTATNDDPTNAGSLPSDITVTEDLLSNVDLSAIDLSDVDHGGSDLTITLSTSTGGNLTATSGGGVTVGGSGTGTVTLTGTQDELNTFLNTASNVRYLHATANLNGNDADTIRVQVTDNGNTGSGGGGQLDFGTVNVDISAVNDAPVNTVPGTQTVAEETTTAIGGISIGDVDASSGNLTTRLQVSNGVINVSLFGSATISAGTNGTGDITIQGSVTDINATLASLTYTGDTDVVGTAADTLTVTTNDGGNTGSGGVLQDVDTVQIDITAINDAPVASSIEPAAIDYTENDGAVTITSTITFSDVDDTHIESATIEISGNYAAGEDFLNFIDQNGITGTWNNGTLTLTGSATLAEYETAIRSITYENTSDDPSAATRTISFTVNDGDVDSNTLTRNIDFTATNDDPTNAGSLPSDITVTEDLLSNVDLSAINLSDVDHGGSDLTITLSTSTGGNLTATSGGGVTVGGSGTGTVTLTGTQDELNTFLDTASNVQYLHSTTNLNGNDADTIRVQVTDNGNTGSGGGGQIDFGTVNVDISAVNDAPVNTVPGTQTVAEETTTAISGISIADVDAASGNLTTRLQVNNGVLNVSLSGSAAISAGTNGTGDITIQGSVTDINATLASLTYTGDADVVGTAADTLTVTTNDGGNTGSGGVLQDVDTVQIDITAVNDAPVASSIEPAAIDYTENDGAVTITSTIAFSDVDDTHIESAVVEISGNYSAGEDFLNFVDQNGITGTWNNGTLTLSGSATLAEYETAIRSITYQNTSDNPSAATRTISFTVNDGDADSNTLTRNIDFTATNDDPTNAGSLPSDLTVTEDLLSNVDLSAIDLSDVDHGGSDLTITLSTSTGGNLTATSGGGVTVGGSGTGTVTLTGTQNELNTFLNTASNVQYLHSTANLNGNDADTIRVQVTDNGNTGSGGGGQIDFGTVNVDISAVNDAPVNTVPGTQTVAEETTTAISGISIADVDAASGNLTTRLQVNNGVLNVSLSGSAAISAGTNGTGDITIQGSVTDINATLASLTYTGDTDVVGTNADTLTVTTNDGGNTGSGGVLQDVDTVQIDITTINDAPVASSIEPAAIDYTENDGAVAITSTIAFSDVDDTHIESAVVEISGNYAAGEDFLNFVDQNGITGTWNNGTLTLSGTATLAEYETAIRSVTYQNTSDDPSAATRTISFTVNDGDADSNTLTRNIDFTAVNDSPHLNHNVGATVLEGGQVVLDDSMLDIGDVDDPNSELTYTVSTTPAHGHLAMIGSPSTPITQFTQQDLDLHRVIYVHDGSESTLDSFDFSVADGGEDDAVSIDQSFQIRITPVNEAPTSLASSAFSIDETTDTTGGIALGTLTTIDPDAGDHFTYAVVGGDDAAVFSIGGIQHDQLVMDDGYLSVGGQTEYDVIIRTTDSGGLYIEQAVTVVVNDINQAPVAGDDTFNTLIGEALTMDAGSLLQNDTDDDGDALFVQIVSQPAHGTVSVDADGNIVYTPHQGYFGGDEFSYAAHDGTVTGNTATVSINVEVYVSSGTSPNVVESQPAESNEAQKPAPESPPNSSSASDSGNASPAAQAPAGSNSLPSATSPETTTRARHVENGESLAEGESDQGPRPERELSGADPQDRDDDSGQRRILAELSATSTRLPLSALELQQFDQIMQQDIAQSIVWHRWEEMLQEDQQEATAIVIGSVGVTAGLVSLGYVAWIIRGGAFFAASLSSLPAWRVLDPATFLDAYRRRDSRNDVAERIFDDNQ